MMINISVNMLNWNLKERPSTLASEPRRTI